MSMQTATTIITGRVGTDPVVSGGSGAPDRTTFRVVTNYRRYDGRTGGWVDAGEYWATIVCWRDVARGAAASIRRGDPVLVVGRPCTHTFETDGVRRSRDEIAAAFVGHDLSKGTSEFRKFNRDPGTAGFAPAAGDGPAPGEGEREGDETGAEPEFAAQFEATG